MEYLTRDQIGRPTAGMSQRLRFRQVLPFSSQLLGQQLMRRDIYCGTVIPLKDSIFDYRNAHTTNVPDLPIGAHYPGCDIAAAVLLMQLFHCFSQTIAVLRMDRGEELLKIRSTLCRVKSEYFVNFVGPIDI